MNTGGTQYYYGDYRLHFRRPWPVRTLSESLTSMNQVEDEDRVTVRQKMSSNTGFTGLCIFNRLYALYNFDILNDFVFDVMHTLLLRIIRRHLEYFKEKGYLNSVVEERLRLMPWTAGI